MRQGDGQATGQVDHGQLVFQIQLIEDTVAAVAGIVDEDVDLQPRFLNRMVDFVGSVSLAQVLGDGVGLDAVRLVQFIGQLVQPLLSARHQHEIQAVAGDGPGVGLADSRGCAGDQRG